jgi:hypothetical protein
VPKPVEKVRAEARQAREKSDKEREEASASELVRLLTTQQPKERLEALNSSEILLQAQRLELVAHLQEIIVGPTAVEKISADVASWRQILLSRLPYRIVPWTINGLVAVSFVAAALVAYPNTPRDFVVSVFDHDVLVEWPLGDEKLHDVLHANQNYGRTYITSDWSELRVWDPGVGYRYIWSQNSNLTPVKAR